MGQRKQTLITNSFTAKDIAFRKPSLQLYVPLTPIVEVEQVGKVKLYSGVMRTSTLFANSHLDNVICIDSKSLYLFNQLRRRRSDIYGVAKVFVSVVVAQFVYATPAFAGTITADDIDALTESMRRFVKLTNKWGFTNTVPSVDELCKNIDRKSLQQ